MDNANGTTEQRLTLRSQIGDLALVPGWIESLAADFTIPSNTQYAMNLCLEEVLSNIIRHGYSNQPGHPITIRYLTTPDRSFQLVIDDEAPPFDPLAAEELPLEDTLEGTRVGGLGLRLVRDFASTLNYERTPVGNRLCIGFSANGQS